jgi:uncharacterized protein YndB with AHSA1/START domain
MGTEQAHPFKVEDEVTVDASPEQVWEAITSGPHIDSWLMGRTEIEPRQGGAARTNFGGFVMESTVTAWEPPKRLAYQTGEGPDGALTAFEYRVEGRGGGKTVIRFVHSGFLAGAGWEAEYDALKKGDPAYLHTLAQYVTHFAPRTATRNIFAPIPASIDKNRAWAVFTAELGLTGTPSIGDLVKSTLDGLPPIEGVVDFVNPDFLGVLASDGLYRFIHGHDGSVVVEHHIFAEHPDERETVPNWQSWGNQAFA